MVKVPGLAKVAPTGMPKFPFRMRLLAGVGVAFG